MSEAHDPRQPQYAFARAVRARMTQKTCAPGSLPDAHDGVSAQVMRAVWRCYADFADWESGAGAYPSYAQVADLTGCSRRQVQRAVQALTETGWLLKTREATKAQAAHYKVLMGGDKVSTGDTLSPHEVTPCLQGIDTLSPGCRQGGLLPDQGPDQEQEEGTRAHEPAREGEAVTAAAPSAQATEPTGLSSEPVSSTSPGQPEQSGEDAAMLDAWLMAELADIGVSLSVPYATRLAAQLLRSGSLGAARAYVEGWIVRHGHDPDQAKRALRWLYQDAAAEVPKYENARQTKPEPARAHQAPDPERERRRQAERDLEAADALLDEERKRDPGSYFRRIQTEPRLVEAVRQALAARQILAGTIREVCA